MHANRTSTTSTSSATFCPTSWRCRATSATPATTCRAWARSSTTTRPRTIPARAGPTTPRSRTGGRQRVSHVVTQRSRAYGWRRRGLQGHVHVYSIKLQICTDNVYDSHRIYSNTTLKKHRVNKLIWGGAEWCVPKCVFAYAHYTTCTHMYVAHVSTCSV